ncbi:hypothetical protein SISSUDRAFT_965060, partial [Sistotremastrum suecicum HHB10207 ss-3]
RAFLCPVSSCGKQFKTMEQLKRHMQKHNVKRPYSCSKCGKTFSRYDNLERH